MTVPCKFVGGPLDGQTHQVAVLLQCQIIFQPAKRLIWVYNRIDELVYVFEPVVSQSLTKDYDKAFIKLGAGTAAENTITDLNA